MTKPSRSCRCLLAVTAAVLTAGALGGCGNGLSSSSASAPDAGGSSIARGDGTPSASTSPAGATGGESSGGASGEASGEVSDGPSGGTDPAASDQGPQPCLTNQLDVGLDQPAGGEAAGSVYVLLTFTNKSAVTCTMSGHPGVSFVGMGNGTQLGTSADRTGEIRTVTLRPGDATDATVKVAQAGNYDADDCVPTTSDGLRVYPPDTRASVYLPYRTQACRAELGRGHSQLQVSAVGQSR